MNVMVELRKCCNQGLLIRGAEERILADAAASGPQKSVQEKSADLIQGTVADGDTTSSIDWAALTAEQLVKSSGKMVLLAKIFKKLAERRAQGRTF